MDLSIIIVNFKTYELTRQAIESIYNSQTNYQFEIIVIDNHSQDQSPEKLSKDFPEIRMIVNEENVGFSRANNQGIKASRGRYLLLLNSDTIIEQNTIDVMVRFMDQHTEVGASGCKVLLTDGRLDKACRRGFPTPLASFYYLFGFSKLFPVHPHFNQYHLSHLDENKDYPVDCLVGAFMLIRREVIDQIGYLDEDFFMYGEDIDYCYRIKEAGWQIHYYPYTSIIHFKGASSRKKSLKLLYEFHRAMFLFHRKHYRHNYFFIVNGFVYTGIFVRFILSLIKNVFKVR